MTAAALRVSANRLGPGVIAGLLLAVMAKLLSQNMHAPAPLIAVVLGMMLGAMGLQAQLGAGLDLFAKPGLRLGVAMMGWQRAEVGGIFLIQPRFPLGFGYCCRYCASHPCFLAR